MPPSERFCDAWRSQSPRQVGTFGLKLRVSRGYVVEWLTGFSSKYGRDLH